jgi:hypothetical protein
MSQMFLAMNETINDDVAGIAEAVEGEQASGNSCCDLLAAHSETSRRDEQDAGRATKAGQSWGQRKGVRRRR